MSGLKIHDVVICVDNKGCPELILGKHYSVTWFDERFLKIHNAEHMTRDGELKFATYYHSRFAELNKYNMCKDIFF